MTKDFLRLYNLGLREANYWYARAVANQIRGDTEAAEKAWVGFENAVADVMTLSYLTGVSETYTVAKQGGMPQEPQEFPVERPETFARPSPAFKPGQFWRYIRTFRNRIPMGWKEVEARRKQARRLAEKIRKAENAEAIKKLKQRLEALRMLTENTFVMKGATQQQAKRIKQLIAESIENRHVAKGLKTGGMSKFIRRAQVEGIINATHARLEVVYRTNISSAYNEAAYEVAKRPETKAWAPLLRLFEVHDRRTRGAPGGEYATKGKSSNPGFHWQMDGYIETPERMKAQNLIPPNGFNCRGSIRAVSRYEAMQLKIADKDGNVDRKALDRYNLQRQKLIDKGLYPDPGFKR
jgi:hypothetical protein